MSVDKRTPVKKSMSIDKNASIENLITDHIDIWTSAIKQKSATGRGSSKKIELYGIKKLRELILELAVRGKLVPQDPNDEPASVLLESIAEEKAQLIKDKKIKKPKKLPEITDDEKPFELPEGWEWVRLGSIGGIFNGNSVNARLKDEKYTGLSEGLPFIATKDIGYGFDKLDYQNGVLIPFDEPKFKIAQKNSVLICAEGGSAGKKCGIVEQDVCFGNKLFAIDILGNLDPRFILATYLTPTFFTQFSNAMTGIIGGISSAKFGELLISVPPEQEQQRIVAKVDELMALCDELESQTESSLNAHQTLVTVLLDTLVNSQDADELAENWTRLSDHFDTLFTTEHSIDQLKQTVLQLAVMGKLVQFGDKIKDFKLKELLIFGPRNGFSAKEVSFETELKVLKLGATSYGDLNLEESKFIDEDIPNDSHLWLRPDDILIQRGNSSNFVGSNVLITKEHYGYIYPDLMMKIRANELVEPSFLSLALSAPNTREFLWGKMTGTSGTMPKISKSIVESIPIRLPLSREIQKSTVAIVGLLIRNCDDLKLKISETQIVKNRLADEIVKGGLI